MTQSRVQGSEPLLWPLRFMRWDHICTRWSWGILCKYLVSWLRVGALEGCQGSALPGGNAFYAMCYLCFVCVCRSAWVYGVCVTVLSLCLVYSPGVYSVQPFFQYISVPEFPSCLLISSNLYTVCLFVSLFFFLFFYAAHLYCLYLCTSIYLCDIWAIKISYSYSYSYSYSV